MNKKKRLLKKTAIYGVGNIGSKILTYLMTVIYTYYITAEELGYYDLILTTVNMCQPLVVLQINDGVYRWLVEGKDNQKKIISSAIKFIMLIIGVTEFFFWIVNFRAKIEHFSVISLYFISTVIYILLLDTTRGLSEEKTYALSGVINGSVMLLCEIFALFVLHRGIEALLFSKVFANVVVCLFILSKEKMVIDSIKMKIDFSLLSEILKYSIPLIPNTICWWIIGSSDRYIINYSIGISENGIYSIANKFPTILTTMTGIFYLAWQDSAIKEYNSENRDAFFSEVLKKYSKFLFSFVILFIPIIRMFIELFVSLEYKESGKYVGYLCLGAVYSSLCSFLGIGYQISKESGRSLMPTIVAALVNIIVNIMLIGNMGLQAASLSTFCAYFFLFIVRLYHTRKYFKLRIDCFQYFILVVLSLVIVMITNVISGFFVLLQFLFLVLVLVIFINMREIKSFLDKKRMVPYGNKKNKNFN